MKIKISSWKILINNELKRLYEGKSIKLWVAQYGKKSNFQTHYQYEINTTLEEFNDPKNWYDWTNLEELNVKINYITCHGRDNKWIKIKFDPIIYQGIEIAEMIFSNKTLILNEE